MRLLGRVPLRMALGGAGAVLLACVAITVIVVRTGGAACAAPAAARVGAAPAAAPAAARVAVPAAALASGKATFYAATGAGNCSFDAVPTPLVVALGPAEYRNGSACGGYLDVSGPKGSVRVKVVDQCPECPAGHIDLSRDAFTRIGNPTDGIVPVTYRTVSNPGVPGPLTVRVKEGSSAYWLALRFDNHGNALTSVELKAGNSFQRLAHTDYNYWIDENGAGGGPYTLRLTDSAGHQTTVSNVRLAPETVQRTGVSMYSGGAAQAANPAASKAAPSASAPAPSASAPAPSPPAAASQPAAQADALPPGSPVKTGCG